MAVILPFPHSRHTASSPETPLLRPGDGFSEYGAKCSTELSTDQMADLLRRIINLGPSRHWRKEKRRRLSPEDQSALLARVIAVLDEKNLGDNGLYDNEERF